MDSYYYARIAYEAYWGGGPTDITKAVAGVRPFDTLEPVVKEAWHAAASAAIQAYYGPTPNLPSEP